MLFEKTTYLDDFPINIRVAEITEYPFHYHQDVEFVYVLKGEVYLKDVSSHYLLKEGDVFTINGHEVHGMKSTDKENAVAIIQISNRYFTRYFPDLAKACYMSYAFKDKYLKLDALRKMLLNILLDYSRRSFDYKNTCTEQMIEVIKYLNSNFNLFAFENQLITNFNNDNPVVIERISRIINYVYDNHAGKITLEDLAEREHLSPYYLSHLISDHMGISFQEFLHFARVEMSEIPLLETDRKISAIAKDVGFSTTSYYDRFFSKWFGHTPLEHRQMYTSSILDASKPAMIRLLSENRAVSIIRRCISAACDQENSSSVINNLHLTVGISDNDPPLMQIRRHFETVITTADYNMLGDRLFALLYELGTSKVNILCRPGDDEAAVGLITNRLSFAGYETLLIRDRGMGFVTSSGFDSISAALRLVASCFAPAGENIRMFLRDQDDSAVMLKGEGALMTSCLVPKPSFYTWKLLKNISGSLVGNGKYYYVIKNDPPGAGSYTLVVMNYNEDILRLCSREAGAHETCDVIASFKDELSVDFSMPAKPGQYVVAKYAVTADNSVFSNMADLGFPSRFPLADSYARMLNNAPQSQVSIETVTAETLHVSSVIKGAGINVIVVAKAESGE